jgi:hypothetical protein
MQIPFDPYDFFGYLASGLMVVVGMDLVFGFPDVLGRDLKVVDAALLALAVYVAGHLIATPAKALLEDGIAARILGRPSKNLLSSKTGGVRAYLFPGYFAPLPAAIRDRILGKLTDCGDDGEARFLMVRFSQPVRADERLLKRLDNFRNQYGFARNLAFSCGLVGAALLIKGGWYHDPLMTKYGATAAIAGVLLWYRFLKFFRQYSYELFNCFADMPGAAK